MYNNLVPVMTLVLTPPSQISIALQIFSGAIPRALLHPYCDKTAAAMALRIPLTARGKLLHTNLRDSLFGSAFLNRRGFMLNTI